MAWVTIQVLTQGQCCCDTLPVGDTSRSHKTYILSLELLIQHVLQFRNQGHDARSLTELVTTSINTLCHKHICSVLHSLAPRIHISHLNKNNRRLIKRLDGLDNSQMGLQVTIRREQPYRCGTVLC